MLYKIEKKNFFCHQKSLLVILGILNLALLGMVFLGGITRLTGSGLSIVEWGVLSGVLPPFTESAWQELFKAYQQFPEFQKINFHFDLIDFKKIFWLEYLHRLLGRSIGLILLIPTFILFREPRARKFLLALWCLGAAQGAMGWWMVKSGLVDVPWVSPFRLTLHLLLALLIVSLSWILWLEQISLAPFSVKPSIKKMLKGAGVLIVFTIAWGGLVAGHKAGLLYNTFPLMEGNYIPDSFFEMIPWWRNFLENPGVVQWTHRCLALVTAGFIIMLVTRCKDMWPLGAIVLCQVALGVWTLLSHVSCWVAACHQLMAFLLVGCWLWAWKKCD